jgi:hypothetical protein
MLAIVCKTFEGVKALEKYDGEGLVNSRSGLHLLGSSIGSRINGRFRVICLEDLRQEYPTLALFFFFFFFSSNYLLCKDSNYCFFSDHMLVGL